MTGRRIEGEKRKRQNNTQTGREKAASLNNLVMPLVSSSTALFSRVQSTNVEDSQSRHSSLESLSELYKKPDHKSVAVDFQAHIFLNISSLLHTQRSIFMLSIENSGAHKIFCLISKTMNASMGALLGGHQQFAYLCVCVCVLWLVSLVYACVLQQKHSVKYNLMCPPHLVSISAAWMVLERSSATPTPSTLMRWGWNRASGASNRSPPTLITRPSGSWRSVGGMRWKENEKKIFWHRWRGRI